MKPHPDYPMAWVNAYGMYKNSDHTDILASHGIELIGPWEEVASTKKNNRSWGHFRAPAYLGEKPAKRKSTAKRR